MKLKNNSFAVTLMFIFIFIFVLLAMQYTPVLWTAINTPVLRESLLFKLAPLFATALFVTAMFYTRANGSTAAVIFTRVMYIWLGVMFIWFSVSMVFMAGQLTAGFLKVKIPQNLPLYCAIFTAILSIASIVTAALPPRIAKVNLQNPFGQGETLKIVQVSDSHLGIGVSPERFKKLADKINALNPDIIVLTGDIIEETNINTLQYTQILKDLKARYGKYAVTGNHEYYRGVQNNVNIWLNAGIIPLQNSATQAGSINIIGVNDIKTANISKAEFNKILARDIDKNKFNLLLSHTPVYFKEAADDGVNLMLSGHTHNGQIWPFGLLARLSFKYIYGLHSYNNAHIYVTSGTFFWGPAMRLFTRNEIVLITLS